MWLCWQRRCDRGMQMVPVFVYVVVFLPGIVVATGPNQVQSDDVCVDDGASLQCDAGFGVHVHRMQCGDGMQECSTALLKVAQRLCQGQNSCGGLGLRDMFSAHCHSAHAHERHVVVRFTCDHASSRQHPSVCRTNLCSPATQSLSCPADSTLHVRNLTCEGGQVTCPPPTFVTLFTLCEGRRECDASGLRMLPSLAGNCSQSTPPALRNVFIDYVCVPERLVWSRCEGQQHHTLTEPFGVLMNPGLAGGRGPDRAGEQCNWFLTPENKTREVHVLVHMAYSKWSAGNCTSDFLQIRFKDCETSESVTRHFCDLHQVNSPVTSCGPVHVTSLVPSASDQADRFLLSYQMVQKGSETGTPAGMAVCATALLPHTSAPLTTRPTTDRRNYGPGGTMFDYSDTIRHTGEDAESDDTGTEGTLQLKLIILYVFFGVVIIALVIALVYVLVSYRGISRRSRHQGDSSEKAALWRHDDTPLDTFNTNSHTSLSDAATSNPHSNATATTPDTVHTPLTPESQVVACTVHAESMPEENRHSTGSRFSSFLPGGGRESEQPNGLPPISPLGGGDISRTGSLPRSWSAGSGRGMSRSSTRSSSFKMNGELGNIYETLDSQEDHARLHFTHRDPNFDGEGEETPLVQAPPSPPLPPPPPPLGYDPSYVEHYMVNNDEYALVRKPRSPNGRNGSQSSSSPTTPSPHYGNSRAQYGKGGNSLEGRDPTCDGVDIFRDSAGGPVVGFRPTSGPYDRDRSSRSEPVSPSSGGTSRHRWDEL